MDSVSLSHFAERLPPMQLPDLVYGFNSLVFEDQSAGISLDMNCFDALSLANLETREGALYRAGPYLQTHINYVPSPIKVANAGLWARMTLPSDSLFKDTATAEVLATTLAADFGNDWTYSTPYKGLFKGMRSGSTFLPLPANFSIETTEQELPVERLGRDNPVLWASEVDFFEDELDDSGSSRSFVRVRSMRDCWFALLRSYVRVDQVLVRILDTRLYHEFNTTCILREFQVRESSYQELRASDFKVDSNWTTAPNQSDLVYPYTRLKGNFKDKISYE